MTNVTELINSSHSLYNFYQELIPDQEIHSRIQLALDDFWNDNYEKFILESDTIEASEEKELLEKSLIDVKINAKEINSILNIKDPEIFLNITLDLDEILKTNIERNKMSQQLKDFSNGDLNQNINEEIKIKKLFQK